MGTSARTIPPQAVLVLALLCMSAGAAHAAWPVDGAAVCTESHTQLSPVIVTDNAGGAVVIWEDIRFSSSDLYAQRIDSTGAVKWSVNGISACSASGAQSNPEAVPDHGGAVVAWEDFRSSDDAIYAQRLDALGVPQWGASGMLIGNTTEPDRSPVLLNDGSLGLSGPVGYYLAWTKYAPGTLDIEMKHFDQTGTTTWGGTAGLTLAAGNAVRSGIVMASDGIGSAFGAKGAVVVWQHTPFSGPNGSDIIANRVSPAGAVQWGAGVVVCGELGEQVGPAIANVGGGNTIVAWTDRRSVERDLYAQKLSSSGTTQWLAGGLPVCRASGDQTLYRIASDGSGGVYLVWTDMRSGASKIFAQHLDGNGQRLWALDGIPLCSEAGEQTVPALLPFGASGAIVAWVDSRSGTQDICAQRFDAGGVLLWGDAGIVVCAAEAAQREIGLVGGGGFSAMAAWRDGRAGNDDIYANRLAASGGVLDAGPRSAESFRLSMASPNPSRRGATLRLELSQSVPVEAAVLDLQGRLVRQVLCGESLGAGTHTLRWDGDTNSGAAVAPGVYFVRVRAGRVSLDARVVVLQ